MLDLFGPTIKHFYILPHFDNLFISLFFVFLLNDYSAYIVCITLCVFGSCVCVKEYESFLCINYNCNFRSNIYLFSNWIFGMMTINVKKWWQQPIMLKIQMNAITFQQYNNVSMKEVIHFHIKKISLYKNERVKNELQVFIWCILLNTFSFIRTSNC